MVRLFRSIAAAMLVILVLLALGCDKPSAPTPAATSSAATDVTDAGGDPTEAPVPALPTYQGSAVVRDTASRWLAIADEDHSVLRIVAMPMTADSEVHSIALAGRPAQLIATPKRLLLTIREPSLLVGIAIGTVDDPSSWKEQLRVQLPNDAWGLAIDQAQTTAYVTSAWTHQVSAIDLADPKVRWSVSVAREPRGVLVAGDDMYVNHLVGSDVTRLTELSSTEPRVERVALPPAPLRTPVGVQPAASLGYALALSPDGRRLFVPRHALGVVGEWDWYGATTIDVLDTKTRAPLLAKPKPRRVVRMVDFANHPTLGDRLKGYWEHVSTSRLATEIAGGPTLMASSHGRQPRHVLYRKTTDTILIASEGQNEVMEYDALTPAPAAFALKRYKLGYEQRPVFELPTKAGAPTGMALSRDEGTLFVYCRSTDDLVAVPLEIDEHLPEPKRTEAAAAASAAAASATATASAATTASAAAAAPEPPAPIVLRLVDDKAHKDDADHQVEVFQMGRAAYYQAASQRVGQGVACASCHPDGRDDGFVWREMTLPTRSDPVTRLIAHPRLAEGRYKVRYAPDVTTLPDPLGGARQTPMLAGRVSRRGPYGWRAESETLAERVGHGLALHRAAHANEHDYSKGELSYYAMAIAHFLKHGLVPPHREEQALTEQQTRGRTLFQSPAVGCVDCHDPQTEHTDGTGYPKIVESAKDVRNETAVTFRTPSLKYVAGTPPYFHDGSRSTLKNLIDHNRDRMGKTAHLSDDDRAALVAYLETL